MRRWGPSEAGRPLEAAAELARRELLDRQEPAIELGRVCVADIVRDERDGSVRDTSSEQALPMRSCATYSPTVIRVWRLKSRCRPERLNAASEARSDRRCRPCSAGGCTPACGPSRPVGPAAWRARRAGAQRAGSRSAPAGQDLDEAHEPRGGRGERVQSSASARTARAVAAEKTSRRGSSSAASAYGPQLLSVSMSAWIQSGRIQNT